MPQAAPKYESHASVPDILPQMRSQNDAMLANPSQGLGYGRMEMEEESSCFIVMMYDGLVKFLPDGSNRRHEKQALQRCCLSSHFEQHSYCRGWVNLGFRLSSCR